MLKKIGLMAISTVSVFAMHNAEININNKDLELSAKMDMGQFNYNVEPDSVFVGAKYLHADEKYSDLNNVDDYYELNFLMKQKVDNDFTFGLGVKVNHTAGFTGVPLGVEAGYKMPVDMKIPLYLGASLYYSPDVLSVDGADGFLEYRVNLDIKVIENGSITLGYRSLDIDYGDTRNSVQYNASAYAGFKFDF